MKSDWQRLASLEPRLGTLLGESRSIERPSEGYFCANDIWYGHNGWQGFAPRVLHLVGWLRSRDDKDEHPELHSSEAYELAIDTIYDALPDCREYSCVYVA